MWGPSSRSYKGGNTAMGTLLIGAVIGALTTTMFLLFVSSGAYKCPQTSSAVNVREELHMDLEGFDWGKKNFFGNTYMKRRSNFTYYKSVVRLAQQYAPDAKSIIDVGAPFPFVMAFDWIPQKTMLNDRYPDGITAPSGVSLVQADFFKYEPTQKFDLVICNQVMEHVDDPAAFAKKLLSIGKVVIASVPYMWAAGKSFGHVQHFIDHERLISWFGRDDYSEVGIVNEVQRICGASCRRVFVVYQPEIPIEERIFNPTHTSWKKDGTAKTASTDMSVEELAAKEDKMEDDAR